MAKNQEACRLLKISCSHPCCSFEYDNIKDRLSLTNFLITFLDIWALEIKLLDNQILMLEKLYARYHELKSFSFKKPVINVHQL